MNNQHFHIVGIGASAGGINALQEFFSALPDDAGVAFVVVLHIPKDKPSRLNKVLQLVTKMPVVKVTQNITMQPNHVYVISEGVYLEAAGETLAIRDRDNEGRNRAVDVLFKSLAVELKNRTIGVVLSGVGSDGLEGVKMIEDNGGFVLVQKPESAAFNGMPMTIVHFDHPDVIDTPEVLAKFIIDYVNSFQGLGR